MKRTKKFKRIPTKLKFNLKWNEVNKIKIKSQKNEKIIIPNNMEKHVMSRFFISINRMTM